MASDLRDLCKRGKYTDIINAIGSTPSAELRRGFDPDQSTPLLYLAARGYLDGVRELIEKHDCDPAYQNVHGITALHCASYCGRIAVVKYLVTQKRCDPTIVDKKGACPIIYSASSAAKNVKMNSPLYHYSKSSSPTRGNLNVAKFLLSQSAASIRESGKINPRLLSVLRLPLTCGSCHDLKAMSEVLKIKPGSETKKQSSVVYSCLRIAVDDEKWDHARQLLYSYPALIKKAMEYASKCKPKHNEFNKDDDDEDDYEWCDGWDDWHEQSRWGRGKSKSKERLPKSITPFHRACMHNRIDLIKTFLEVGICKPDVISLQIVIKRNFNNLLCYLIQSADHPLIMDEYDEWPSLVSHVFDNCRYKNDCYYDPDVVSHIVKMCLDSKDRDGNSPLHLACRYSVTFILNKFNESEYLTVRNDKDQLPLHIACAHCDLRNIKAVSSLPQLDINTRDRDGNTPFHVVCMSVSPFSTLFGLKVQSCTWKKSDILECFNYFVSEKNCDLNIQNGNGELPIHIVLKNNIEVYGDNDLWNKLIALICNPIKFDVNTQDRDGDTPLHIACRTGNLTAIKLLASPVNVNMLNVEHCLPLHYAATSLEAVKIVSDGCNNMQTQNSSGKTPFHIACEEVQIDVVRFLVAEKGLLPKRRGQIQTGVYDNLYIHLLCQDECDMKILKAVANQENVNKCYEGHCEVFQGDLPMHVACRHQNIAAIELFLEFNCDLSRKCLRGMLPFHVACSQSLTCVEALSQSIHANDVNVRDDNGNTPLHLALKHHHLDVVDYLLRSFSCNLTLRNKQGELPLHLACFLNSATMILKRYGNDGVNSCTTEGSTPLHIACMAGSIDIAQCLIKEFDCTPSVMAINKYGKIPVDYACKHSLEMVKLVGHSCTVESLVSRHLDYRGATSPTTLDIACFFGSSLDIVQYLVDEKGCSLEALRSNQSALGYACGLIQLSGHDYHPCDHPKVVEFLISKCGYDPTMILNDEPIFKSLCKKNSCDLLKALTCCSPDLCDAEGNTPLHYACQHGYCDVIDCLVGQGCDQTLVNREGDTALHKACCHSLGATKLVNQCDVNVQNLSGNTPLHLSCLNGKEDIICYLVEEKRCDLNIANNNGEFALHIACQKSLGIVKHLSKSDINCQDINGNTPLHIAALNSKYELVVYLLKDRTCRADIRNNLGDLALHSVIKAAILCDSNKDSSVCDGPSILTVVEVLMDRNIDAVITDNNEGNTPAHIVIRAGKVKLLEIFFRNKKLDERRSEFIRVAVECGQSLIVQWLTDYKANSEVSLQELVDGNTIIHLACQMDNDSYLLCILESASNLDEAFSFQNDKKDTPLHILAAQKRDLLPQVFTLIKSYCKNPNIQNSNGDTPLHIACSCGNSDFAEKILSISNHMIPNNQGDLPVHLAAGQSLEVIRLVATSSNINMQNHKGETPLHVACGSMKLASCVYLIKHFNCLLSIVDNAGNTALHQLFAEPTDGMIINYTQTLLLYNLTEIDVLRAALNSECISKAAAVANMVNEDGDTILSLACRRVMFGQVGAISILVNSFKCRTDVSNNQGGTPLHYACVSDYTDVVKMVSDCDPTAQIKTVTVPVNTRRRFVMCGTKIISLDTPLHVACRKGKVTIVKHLLKTGHASALNVINEQKELPFHIAVCYRQHTLAQLFLKYKTHFNCNSQNAIGDTPLHIVCKNDNVVPAFVPMLVNQMKCKTDVVNKDGNLPLHIVCQKTTIFMRTITLLSNGLSGDQISLQNTQGNTALHDLLKLHHDGRPMKYEFLKEIVQFITEKMTTVAISNLDGLQPIHLACRHHKLSIVKYVCERYTSLSLEIPHTVLHEACYNDRDGVLLYLLNTFDLDVNIPDHNGDLPLHIAMREKRSISGICMLLEKTLDVNHTNSQGNAPLHELCKGSALIHSYKRLRVLKVLLHDKSKQVQLSVQNIKGQTPLHIVCELECDVVTFSRYFSNSYSLGMSPSDADIEEHAQVQLESKERQNYHIEFIQLLCESGADLTILDKREQMLVGLTRNPDIIKTLLEYGADPHPLYVMHQSFFEKYSSETPPETPVKLFVIGHPLVGKTTLIESLQKENTVNTYNEEYSRTTGIEPSKFSSKIYGDVLFLDFAGQPEYYASHEAFVQSYRKDVPPIILILVNLTEPKKRICSQIKFWCNSIMGSMFTESADKAHLIIIGSHADKFSKSQDQQVLNIIREIRHEVVDNLKLNGNKLILKCILQIDCRKSYSKEMEKLQRILKDSTTDLREEGVLNFRLHCFYVLLIKSFEVEDVITLNQIRDLIVKMSNDSERSPIPCFHLITMHCFNYVKISTTSIW